MKKFIKPTLLMFVLVALLFTYSLSTLHNNYSGNLYYKNIFYAGGDGDPDNPPPKNSPGIPG